MDIKTEEALNNVIISQISLKESIFNKDNVKYDILIKYPDGSTLRNYNDDQYPVIPFCLDEDSIKSDIYFQRLIENQNQNNINNNEKIEKNLIEDNKSNENQENNGLNKNINDINIFQNQSIELKDKIFVLNRQSDKIENIQSMKKEREEKTEENNDVEKYNIDANNKEKEKEKEINDFNFDSLEKSENNLNNEKIIDFNNLNNLDSEKEITNENNKNINKSNNKIQNLQESNITEENIIKNNEIPNFPLNNNKNEKKETNTDFEFLINIDNKNVSEKKNAFAQTNTIENGSLQKQENSKDNKEQEENMEKYEKEMEKKNEEFFEQKLSNGNQSLESDRNSANKKVRRNKNYNQRIFNNKNLLIQEQKSIKENKEKKQQKIREKKNLNKMLLEKEMNEIKKRLQNKKNKKESGRLLNDLKKINNINLHKENIGKTIDMNEKFSSRRSQVSDDKFEKFNTPNNNDICSQLLQTTMDNEKMLYLIPYAKQKEKIKKTFKTIGISNGISYSEYREIKGAENDNNNILNIIRDDGRKSFSKRKDFSGVNSSRKSVYHNVNGFNDTNSEFRL